MKLLDQSNADNVLNENPKAGLVYALVICDDHPAFAKGIARLLEDQAPDLKVVGITSSGQEATQMVTEILPDLVLTDIRMPGMNGIEVARAVKAASPTTKVVILTVSDEQADLYAALKAGASGYITKDKDVTEIAEVLRQVMKGHLIIPAHLAGNFLHDLEAAEGAQFNDHEREILQAIAKGETHQEIAARLNLPERTICRRVEDFYSKLHLADWLEAAIWAVEGTSEW